MSPLGRKESDQPREFHSLWKAKRAVVCLLRGVQKFKGMLSKADVSRSPTLRELQQAENILCISQNHMRKIRKRKLNHLFTNIPSSYSIQLGNKAVNRAGFLRKEITPLTSEITIHTENDRTYRLFRIQIVHNSTN